MSIISEELDLITFPSLMPAAEVHRPQEEQCVPSIDQKFNSKSIDKYK